MTTNALLFAIIIMLAFTNGPSLVEATKLLKEIKQLLEIIEKRGRKDA